MKASTSKRKSTDDTTIKKVSTRSKNIKKKEESKRLDDILSKTEKTTATKTKKQIIQKQETSDDSDDDSDGGWEEVAVDNAEVALDDLMANMNKDPIEIKINVKTGKRATKKEFNLAAFLQREQEAQRKKLAIDVHKSHLVCWLYHGLYLNKLCNNRLLQALALSKLPDGLYEINSNVKMVQGLLNRFKKLVTIENGISNEVVNFFTLNKAILDLKCSNNLEYVLMVLVFLRCLGVKSRLTICFDVFDIKNEKKSNTGTNGSVSDDDDDNVDEEEEVEHSQVTTKKRKSVNKSEATSSKKIKADMDSRPSRKCKERAVYKDDQSESEYFKDDADEDFRKKPRKSQAKKSVTPKKDVDKDRVILDVLQSVFPPSALEQSNDSAVLPMDQTAFIDNLKNSKEILKLKNKKPIKATSRVLSVDSSTIEDPAPDEDVKQKFNDYINYWIEVYLDDEDKWICVEPVKCKLDCVEYIEKRLGPSRTLYVCAFDNDNRIKDVTVRYATEWNTRVRKMRIESFDTKFWWEKVLVKYKPVNFELDLRENRVLNDLLYLKPMPKSISEFKAHPLYILKRHLLKFQAIFPPDSKPIDTIRGEEIYSRQNLVTLRSKQTWLKFARTVKSDEKAYKIVKGRVKQSDFKMGVRQNPDLDLFGFWQTQPYDPPVAINGRVPRNEYGNVELFQKSMLPIGCVHLQNMPNLNKICKKLDIDCVPAVVGFDAHHGFSHAVIDGWVICEEFKDVCVDAYREDDRQNELKRVEMEKERVVGNWKRLLRGLLIRERLKMKYQSTNDKEDENVEESKTDEPKQSVPVEEEKIQQSIEEKNIVKQKKPRAKPTAKPKKNVQIVEQSEPKYETRRTTRSHVVNYNVDVDSDDEEFLTKYNRKTRNQNKKASPSSPVQDDEDAYVPSEKEPDDVEPNEYDENSNKKTTTKVQKPKKKNGKIVKTKSPYFDDFSAKFSTVRRETEPTNGLAMLKRDDETFNLSEDDEL